MIKMKIQEIAKSMLKIPETQIQEKLAIPKTGSSDGPQTVQGRFIELGKRRPKGSFNSEQTFIK